jgi:hypothetical protein
MLDHAQLLDTIAPIHLLVKGTCELLDKLWSTDVGKIWLPATFGEDLGRFAFRTFSFEFSPTAKGKQTVMARATNKIGQTQTTELIHNPAGYHHNVIHGSR